MAALQSTNSAALVYAAKSTTARSKVTASRIDVGVCLMPRQHLGRAALSHAFLRYRRFPAAVRWILPRLAALLALTLYWLIRLLPYWLNR